jgi:hypothetical protein
MGGGMGNYPKRDFRPEVVTGICFSGYFLQDLLCRLGDERIY